MIFIFLTADYFFSLKILMSAYSLTTPYIPEKKLLDPVLSVEWKAINL